jgi:glutamyl-tRNA synthetase
MSDMVLSKSTIREGIRNGEFGGWDDLRLGTLRSLKRRGFHPGTIVQMIKDIGPKPSDVTISFENLAGYNRKKIDNTSNRYFFIYDPKKIKLKNMKIKKIKISLHPDNKKAGYRNITITKNLYVNTDDFNRYKGLEVRLKNLCNVKMNETATYTGKEVRKMPKIQWVTEKHVQMRILTPEKHIKGYGEFDLNKSKVGSVVQLERFGFVKIEKSTKKNIIAIFCHE